MSFDESTEEALILTLLDVANHLSKNGEALAAREGLTTQQWLIMLQIAGDPNCPGTDGDGAGASCGVLASELARARGVSRANISTLVTALLRKDLVQQQDDPQDRRRKRLTLTDAGQAALERLEPRRREANLGLFAELEVAEREALLRGLRHCLSRLSAAVRERDVSDPQHF